MKWHFPFLLPFAWLYGAVVSLRNLLYDKGWKRAVSIGVPVVSVGNITVGGTGKTPMAEFLIGQLLKMGRKPAYLSRGYGRKSKGYRIVNLNEGGLSEFGDEAMQVASRFPAVPVVVCEDRVAGGRKLLSDFRPDILVLDDAFQHRRIHREIDLVMIDGGRMPVGDYLLPAGRLREPIAGLKRADCLVLTKIDTLTKGEEPTSKQIASNAGLPVAGFEMKHGAVRSFFPQRVVDISSFSGLEALTGISVVAFSGLEALTGISVVAFSGLGNNPHFESSLKASGINLAAFFAFPDHYTYKPSDIEKICGELKGQMEISGKLPAAIVLTTEKDYFRLKTMPWIGDFEDQPLHYVEVSLEPVFGWEFLEEKIKSLYRGRAYGANQ